MEDLLEGMARVRKHVPSQGQKKARVRKRAPSVSGRRSETRT
jgi:hypothetical protein